MTEDLLVRMEGIVKRFPGVLANDGVDFDIRRGEIHTLLGENGAGKSTLMSVLAGAYHPDAGSIFIGGKKVIIHSPRDAIRVGVGMVHQHFMLVSSYTVAENVTLGLTKPRFLIHARSLEKDVAEKAQTYGLQVDPSAKIWQLSVGEQQRVEILKMLYRGVKILILDEPTAVLTPQEVDEFFVTLRRMAAAGQGIVFISHKMDEVMNISDRITVMRKGKKIATVAAKETTARDLAIMMVGREVLSQLDKADKPTGKEVLSLQEIWSLSDKRLPALRGLSLSLRAGEILGIAGVAGNGQRELAETMTGLRPVTKGRILVNQKDMTNKKPLQMIERGVAHVPEDRKGTGTIPNLTVLDNLMLKCYRYPPFSRGPFLNLHQIRSYANSLVKRFHIATPSLETETKLLSGGNVQRLILAREIATASELMVAVHPTRGLDIGATEFVHQMLIEQRNNGGAILLISEDLDEVLTLADRVAVIYEGQITGQMAAKDAKIEDIGLMMAGKTMEAAPGETA